MENEKKALNNDPDAGLNMTPEEWAEALAEDPSCIKTYLTAAYARGLCARASSGFDLVKLLREVRDHLIGRAQCDDSCETLLSVDAALAALDLSGKQEEAK